MTQEQEQNLEITKEYFRKVDAQDFSLINLFSNDVQIYFPKFGIGKGMDDLKAFASVFGGTSKSIIHHFEEFHYIVAGNSVVVEGSESGTLTNGRTWEHGRFCSVFTFKDRRITRMHLYEDPDLTAADQERLFWGKPKQALWQPGGNVTSG
jgi:ketosteroid isomerase-like protein